MLALSFYSYCITDPAYFSNIPDTFLSTLKKSLRNHKPDFVCFRDKISQNFQELATVFVNECKNQQIKNILINSYVELACQLNADGVHLTSSQFDAIQTAKSNNLFVIISCHTLDEIEKAKLLGADAVTYSPIFYSPKKAKPLGVAKLLEAKSRFNDILIFGLGGVIGQDEIDAIRQSGADGFASIRFWLKENSQHCL